MNTVKKMMVVAVMLIAAKATFAAADSYLYWMASDTVKNLWSGETVTWNKARVNFGGTVRDYSTGDIVGGTWLTFSDGYEDYGDTANRDDVVGGGAYAWGAFDARSTGESFIFELLNDDTYVGALQQDIDWLRGYIVTSSSADKPSSGAFMLTGVVPETTSGLLSLFGLAALALRRRRRA